jgi:DNA-binding MarR family transcriptional regulator
MSVKRGAVALMTGESRFEAASRHTALVAGFRAKLAGKESPLDRIPAKQREQARREFSELPEVAGEPLPPSNEESDHLVGTLRDTIAAIVRRDGPDLSARQLGVFLTAYMHGGPHTVHRLAADLNLSKPAITRALDRLGELDLARCKVDPLDRRSILVQQTLKGTSFMRDLRGIVNQANRNAQTAAPKPARAKRGCS